MKKLEFDIEDYDDLSECDSDDFDKQTDSAFFSSKEDGTFDFDLDGLKETIDGAVRVIKSDIRIVKDMMSDTERIIGGLNFESTDDFDVFNSADSFVFDDEAFNRIKVKCTECCCCGFFKERDRVRRIFRNAFGK